MSSSITLVPIDTAKGALIYRGNLVTANDKKAMQRGILGRKTDTNLSKTVVNSEFQFPSNQVGYILGVDV